jgi:putative oligomerization/nucleic acid binding protein
MSEPERDSPSPEQDATSSEQETTSSEQETTSSEQETTSSEQDTLSPDQDTRSPDQHTRSISRRRLIGVDVLIGITTILLIVGMFSIWANRLLFNPNNWADASTQLLQDPNVRSTTANYIVDQLYANYDVAGLLKKALPTQFQGLAAPAAGALRNAAVSGAELALSRPRVQDLWRQANYAADQTFINVVEGGGPRVSVNQGAVTLNLGVILDNIASRLGLPSDLSSKLPANVAHLTVFKSNQLKTVQNAGKLVKGLALWLTILCPLLYALAVFLAAGHRRRTLMTVGFAAIFAGVVVFFGRNILETQITNSLTNDASLRVTIRATIAIATGLLVEVAGAVVFVGVILVIAAWFGGPARIARSAREAIAPFLRDNSIGTYAVTLGLLALLFIWDPIPATGTPAGIITFTVLALFGTAVLRVQTEREFPDARQGAATHAVRERLSGLGRGRQSADGPAPTASPPPASTADQLKQLAELRDSGDLTAEEYKAAKDNLLGG